MAKGNGYHYLVLVVSVLLLLIVNDSFVCGKDDQDESLSKLITTTKLGDETTNNHRRKLLGNNIPNCCKNCYCKNQSEENELSANLQRIHVTSSININDDKNRRNSYSSSKRAAPKTRNTRKGSRSSTYYSRKRNHADDSNDNDVSKIILCDCDCSGCDENHNVHINDENNEYSIFTVAEQQEQKQRKQKQRRQRRNQDIELSFDGEEEIEYLVEVNLPKGKGKGGGADEDDEDDLDEDLDYDIYDNSLKGEDKGSRKSESSIEDADEDGDKDENRFQYFQPANGDGINDIVVNSEDEEAISPLSTVNEDGNSRGEDDAEDMSEMPAFGIGEDGDSQVEDDEGEMSEMPVFGIASTSFQADGMISNEYSCNSEENSGGISPELSWTDVPPDTESLAVILVDSNALPEEETPVSWTHWVIYNIDPSTTQLNESIPNEEILDYAMQSQNSWGVYNFSHESKGIGYGGPCPDPGDYTTHTYPFTLYALNTTITESEELSLEELKTVIQENAIASTSVTGHYQNAKTEVLAPAFEITSTSFPTNGMIANQYSCNAEDGSGGISPELSWTGVPPGTESLAFVLVDPNAIPGEQPQVTWKHWVIYNIDANITQLNEGIPNEAVLDYALQSQNSWGVFNYTHPSTGIGYGGPCPNAGDNSTHTYSFTLYALGAMISESEDLTLEELINVIEENAIDATSVTGYYQYIETEASMAEPTSDDRTNSIEDDRSIGAPGTEEIVADDSPTADGATPAFANFELEPDAVASGSWRYQATLCPFFFLWIILVV